MENQNLKISPYGFSATRVLDLGASEYTLVCIAQDTSGSVAPYYKAMEKCLKEVFNACLKSPRVENLMLRLLTFDSNLQEVHGFKPLMDCNQKDYDGCLGGGGATALYDAATNAIEAMQVYGKDLDDNDCDVNGILIIVTDGWDNDSTNSANDVKKVLQKLQQEECLESIVTILIGVGVDTSTSQKLQDFKDTVGISQYIDIGNADAKTLAKLAQFMSSSISSQSESLNSGGPSQLLEF